jgi:hypothetical protein
LRELALLLRDLAPQLALRKLALSLPSDPQKERACPQLALRKRSCPKLALRKLALRPSEREGKPPSLPCEREISLN